MSTLLSPPDDTLIAETMNNASLQWVQANPQSKDPLRLICIGHSLGSHSCGMAGKVFKLMAQARSPAVPRANDVLDKIYALDPAGPSFDEIITREGNARGSSLNWRLKPSDASFVYGLHTDIKDTTNLGKPGALLGLGHYGTPYPVGHVDVCESVYHWC
jgi:hypothetical protein